MSFPAEPVTLHGGCFCKAIQYTINVPTLSERPPGRKAANPIGSVRTEEAINTFPIMSLDHCNSCRGVSGSILQAWFIFPQSWMQFSLRKKDSEERIEPPTRDVLMGEKNLLDSTHLGYFCTSKDVHRVFCGQCGTPFTYFNSASQVPGGENTLPPFFDVALGTMDKESVDICGPPGRQVHLGDGIEWVKRLIAEGEKGL
ncbi:hypothetical protein BGZ60DRAFT_398800 [Tricladium varicosporioides]|nr:hypothetical protein BGZ60DRAFT_398800 [Hymenoscyphus varicosporioides]